MKVLITGGCGFIGSNLAKELLSKGHEVHLLDISDKPAIKLNGATFQRGDITHKELTETATEGCEAVFHEAALISVEESIKNPEKFRKANIEGTRNVLEACRKNDVKKVILASSAAVYGDEPTLPKTEGSILAPKSPYAESKIQNEKDAKKYFEEYGLETVCLRYFNVYGEGQEPNSPYSGVISKFIDCAINGKKPTIYGDGKQTRDFVFIKDVADANILAMEKKGIGGEVFNIATGKEATILELWKEIRGIEGSKEEPGFAPARKGDILRSVADISKAGKVLGYKPKYSIREGLEKTLEYAKS